MCRFFRIVAILVISLLPVSRLSAKDFVVVIDAGHGGHDYGAIGKKTNEKSINLGVALKLGKMIKKNMDDVKVVYTRDGDYFKELQERAEIANKAHGDLFISIHTNSVDKKNKRRTTIKGTATYTLGLHKSAENLAVAKRENSVMMLEDDFSATYCGFDPNSTESYIIFELSQNQHMEQSIDFASKVQSEMVATAGRQNNGVRQAGFWVLAKTGMPAVLIELDFICNPVSEAFLASEKGQNKFAKSIFNAFKSYKASYDRKSGKIKESRDDKPDKVREVEVEEISPSGDEYLADDSYTGTGDGSVDDVVAEDEVHYKVQFLTYPSRLKDNASQFKGLKDVDSYRDGSMWKYTVGNFKTLDEAKKEMRRVRKKFSDAFIITTRGGKRIK